ncbi:AcrR family transcriptional regulator [Bacillus thermophilus]|uniref:AcrR family transcriptional regulator n=1 Tax=Siminovitchia thermophila TaxID=1245522 RepID=A0ABS2R0P9_9BACI|nr:TetR/AcrR family transcriptional regulator [Siminovitchia thermophila]MBM7713202.1 AcrR family transcriptional regulator [Siminovitchia thermophila]
MNARKHRVLLTAQRLFIEKGFAATSVQDILDEAHISKGTFYNYFSSKNECLMAILIHAYEVATARRHELMIGKNRSDKDVFIKQIAIRLEVNREYQLVPLFEIIFHSKDPELRDFIQKHHLTELSWLSHRLVDIYGEESAPYSLDCAIMIVGMLKHFINMWVTGLKEELDTHKLIRFIMRRTDVVMENMIQVDDQLLGDRLFLPRREDLTEDTLTKERILERLSNFANSLDDDHKRKQYIEFLMEEIKSGHPREFLLETVLRAFGETFTGTHMELEAKEMVYVIYNYLKKSASSLPMDNIGGKTR